MIRKMEEMVVNPVQERSYSWEGLIQSFHRLTAYMQRWGVLLFLIGFLLGRAIIVGELSPFAIPFLAVIYHLRRDRMLLAGLAAIVGALSHPLGSPATIVGGLLLFIMIQKILEKWGKGDLNYTPLAVLCTVFSIHILYSLFTDWSSYQLLMAAVEAGLSFVLTLIFVQSLPLITTARKTVTLKNEEIVCLVILLASVMTGTVGWLVMGLSIEHILSRYVILAFAFIAGGAIGATVGVVTGIILSLANIDAMLQMSLLAFSGLLGGLLREGKKMGVASGLLVGTILIGLYVQDVNLWTTFSESLMAILLFLLTPKSIFSKLSKYIPGTFEYASNHSEYARRLREVTVNKVEQFSKIFEHLSQTFTTSPAQDEAGSDKETDVLLSQVTEKTCQICFKKDICWGKKLDQTYRLMKDLSEGMEQGGEIQRSPTWIEWSKHCTKSQKVIEVMEKEFAHHQTRLLYKQKMKESCRLVAEQLSGVSQVMDNFAREIKREGDHHHLQEQQIQEVFDDAGLSIRYVDIISLEEGNVDIEISQPKCHGRDECAKLIAPILSDIVGEHISVCKKECDFYHDGYCKISLCSAKAFTLDTGVASAAKGGGFLSGDNYATLDVGNGKYAIALSDGMGNGERANQESMETLSLLQQILQSGVEETVAIKSINSVLSLRSTDEVFSTLDLAMIDLQTAKTNFLKIGSTPSFIKRGEQCLTVSAHNLPIGILQDIEIDAVQEQLKAGDLLIMITDGIFDAPRHIENKEMWMKRMIMEIDTDDPQEIADILLEKVVRFHRGKIVDDMTVLVVQIKHNIPQWTTISVPGMPKFNLKKDHSLIY